MIIIAVGIGCKKEAKTAQTTPAISIAGSYHATQATGYNDNGTAFDIPIQQCAKADVYTFGTSNNLNLQTSCTNIANVSFKYAIKKDTLFIYTNGNVSSSGLLKNVTTAGFLFDGHAIGSSNNVLTFVKI
ncbi:MAG: hypothetical protein ACHQHN_11740 [Sphingobacteriales bacterium]